MGMTRRGTWLRYGLVSVLLIGIRLGSQWFFSDGVYQGRANVPLLKFPAEVDVVFLLTFTPSFIGLKYLAYDSAVRALTKHSRPPVLIACFIAGYLVTLAMDIACLIAASKPMADSGLAILGPVVQTPVVLLVSTALIAGGALQKGAPPLAGPGTPT